MKPDKTLALEIHVLELMKASFLFEAAVHPVRQDLLCLLEDQQMTTAMICDRLGVDRILCVQHLSILCGGELLLRQTEGGQVFYAVNETKLEELYAAAESLML